MYWAYLQRAPDTPGLNWWVGQLNSGATQEQVRAAFATSGEFEEKVAKICPSVNIGGLKYVLSDHQGSARMVTNNVGALVSRHDYAPYGEELWAGVGLRTTAQGFGATDTVRQRYGLTERDEATGLEHTWWRKYDNTAGRWTSPDPYKGSIKLRNPQSFNRYTYVNNDPLNFLDPSGLYQVCIYSGEVITYRYPGGRTVTVVKANPTVCFEIGGRSSGRTGLNFDIGRNAREIKEAFYKEFGDIFNDCLKEVFGKDAPAKQTIDNAPNLDTQKNKNTLGRKAGLPGHRPTGITINSKEDNKSRTIYMAYETAYYYFDKATFTRDDGVETSNYLEAIYTYAHETANRLDIDKNKTATTYGSSANGDPDTGQAVELCMRKKLADRAKAQSAPK